MSSDDTNNNLSSGFIENPEQAIQSNSTSMVITDDNIVTDDNILNKDSNNNSGESAEESLLLVDSKLMEESNNENPESRLENIIMENEIINNIKYNNNPITEFNTNLSDNIKAIVTLFGNQQEKLIMELNGFIQLFVQKNIEEIQYLKVQNHVLQELIVDLKASESSAQNSKEEAAILELSKMRFEKLRHVSPPSPETHEYLNPQPINLISGTNNNPQRRTRRIRKKNFTEPVHKVSPYVIESTEDEDETQKTMVDDQYSPARPKSDAYRRFTSTRLLNEMLEYPSSDAPTQPESDLDDSEDESETEVSTPEKPKRKKKKKNTSGEDDDYIPKPSFSKTQTRSNISSQQSKTLAPPSSITAIGNSSTTSSINKKPIASSATANIIKVPNTISTNINPSLVTSNLATQPAAPKRRGRPPKRSITTASNSGPIGTVNNIPDTSKNSFLSVTAPNNDNAAERPSHVSSNTTADISKHNSPTTSVATTLDSSQNPTSEIYPHNPPNTKFDPLSLQPSIQSNSSSGIEIVNFSIVNNPMISQNLLGQKKRGPKPKPRGPKSTFTIYDSNSFKLTYEKPGVTKITKASISSNTPQTTVFVEADVSQYSELSNALGNSLSKFGNVSENPAGPKTTIDPQNNEGISSKSTTSTAATTQPSISSSNNTDVSSTTTTTTDTGTTSHNPSAAASSKVSRRFNSHAVSGISSNLNDLSGSPTQKSSHNTTGGILVVNSAPKRNETNIGDDCESISPSKDGATLRDNESVTCIEKEQSTIIKQPSTSESVTPYNKKTVETQQQEHQHTNPPPIVRIRLAPELTQSSASSSTTNNSTESIPTMNPSSVNYINDSTIEERKKLYSRRVRKV